MSAPGSSDALGISQHKDLSKFPFQVPCTQPPPEDSSEPVSAGSKTDMGALALFLVSNWFVNGETVLIDGGVSTIILIRWDISMTIVNPDTACTPLILLRHARGTSHLSLVRSMTQSKRLALPNLR